MIVEGGSFPQEQEQALDFEQLLLSSLEKEKDKGNYVLRVVFEDVDRDAIQENNINPNTTRFQDSPQLQGLFKHIGQGKYAIVLDKAALASAVPAPIPTTPCEIGEQLTQVDQNLPFQAVVEQGGCMKTSEVPNIVYIEALTPVLNFTQTTTQVFAPFALQYNMATVPFNLPVARNVRFTTFGTFDVISLAGSLAEWQSMSTLIQEIPYNPAINHIGYGLGITHVIDGVQQGLYRQILQMYVASSDNINLCEQGALVFSIETNISLPAGSHLFNTRLFPFNETFKIMRLLNVYQKVEFIY